MMPGWNDELRLLLTVALNAAVLGSAYRFASRRAGQAIDRVQAACDAMLIYFIVQYAAVALPGALGVFNLWTMSLVAFGASAGLWVAADVGAAARDGLRPRAAWSLDHLGLFACLTFAAAYAGAYFYDQRFNPPTATDALVYHLPTAVQWMQTGKLGLYPTWYWNPAATYSPATSSTFMAWWMLPPRNDVFVRFFQAPALICLFLIVVRLCRFFGTSRTVAGVIGLSAAMARPFMSEVLFPKDDLYVTAFVGFAVLSLADANLRDRLGAWRVGLAFGMVLACKYTVLLVCPVFLFLVDAPFRARWRARDWLIALSVGVVLFVPWYARNVALFGNPLYPVDVKLFGRTILPGMFGTEPDQQLRTAGGVWRMLATTYHSVPAVLLVLLGVAWAGGLAAAGGGRAMLRDPLRRACLIGTGVTFVVFLVTSPHHEMRYMFPLILLLFGVTGLAVARWVKPEGVRIGVGGLLVVISLFTAFDRGLLPRVAELLLPTIMVAILVVGALELQLRRLRLGGQRLAVVTGVLITVVFAAPAYIYWSSYVIRYYLKTSAGLGEAGINYTWSVTYVAEAPLWTFVREEAPDDATIAVANTYFVYPFLDATYNRRLGYAPVRRGVHDFVHFPRLGDTVPGDLIVARMTEAMNAEPDKQTWLENLRRMGAQYLVIATMKEEPNPPERRFVEEERERFELLFNDPVAGSVYRIRDLTSPATSPAASGNAAGGAAENFLAPASPSA